MILAGLLALGEDLLICDLAETYGIYDMEAFKPSYIGTLAEGLREDSRIKMKQAGLTITIDQMVAAYTADKVANIVWMLSDDGMKGLNEPKSILAVLTGKTQEKNSNIVSFSSPEEFEEAMKKYER